MTITKNKAQLNKLIFDGIIGDHTFLSHVTCHQNLLLTGDDPAHLHISKGVIAPWKDLETSHEEADIIIVPQAVSASQLGAKITVIANDTDVFAMLIYFYQ